MPRTRDKNFVIARPAGREICIIEAGRSPRMRGNGLTDAHAQYLAVPDLRVRSGSRTAAPETRRYTLMLIIYFCFAS